MEQVIYLLLVGLIYCHIIIATAHIIINLILKLTVAEKIVTIIVVLVGAISYKVMIASIVASLLVITYTTTNENKNLDQKA